LLEKKNLIICCVFTPYQILPQSHQKFSKIDCWKKKN